MKQRGTGIRVNRSIKWVKRLVSPGSHSEQPRNDYPLDPGLAAVITTGLSAMLTCSHLVSPSNLSSVDNWLKGVSPRNLELKLKQTVWLWLELYPIKSEAEGTTACEHRRKDCSARQTETEHKDGVNSWLPESDPVSGFGSSLRPCCNPAHIFHESSMCL